MQSPSPKDELLNCCVWTWQPKSAEHPTHMNVSRNVYGIVVPERNLEVSCKGIGRHACNLRPDSVEFQEPVNNVGTGRSVVPNFLGIALVLSSYASNP